MFSRLHDKLGTAGLIVAVVALVAAVTGTAMAAGGLSGLQKKEVKKIAKKYAGKQGAAGPQGSAGATGKAGANGTAGPSGASGAAGKSVEIGAEPAGANCATGGTWVAVEGSATKRFACNGEESHSPTLGPGETSAGLWSFTEKGPIGTWTPINFPLRLPSPPAEHVIQEGEASTTECPGTADEPDAAPGHLCIYEKQKGGGAFWSGFTVSHDETIGTILEYTLDPTQEGFARGSWAVTAECSGGEPSC